MRDASMLRMMGWVGIMVVDYVPLAFVTWG